MAIFLRRAFFSRNFLLLRSSFHSRDFSHILCSPNLCNSSSHRVSTLPAFDFLRETRRGFAKGRKSRGKGANPIFKPSRVHASLPSTTITSPRTISEIIHIRKFSSNRCWYFNTYIEMEEDNDAADTVEVVADIGPTVKATAVLQMEAAIVSLSQQLSKLRTGRASAGMLDHIIVETSGVKMPLSRVAVVSVIDSKTLSVTPYDPNALKEMENAIVSSPLGLNPKADGQRLIAVIPPLTKEHIQAICKVVSKSSEDVKQSIRRARQKALDTMKKAGSSFPKDNAKRLEKEVDDLTKKFIKSAEDMCKAKEKEITEG